MKRITTAIGLVAITSMLLIACGGGAKDKKGALNDKKIELEKLKKEQASLNKKIGDLEAEISKLDPSIDMQKAKLVSLETVGSDSFSHFIDLQGKIDAQSVATVSPQMPGVARAILVKQGQRVSKGQLLVKLDDAVARQQVVAAQQQTGQLKARLAQAQTVYERYKGLWAQNIGSEIQVINAKADVDALQAQLNAANANVSLAQQQANLSNVYAPISGTADMVNIVIGENFTGYGGDGKPQIQIVNSSDMKVQVQIPENYIEKVKVGSILRVTLPESDNRVFETKINVIGSLIDPSSRTFNAEGTIPKGEVVRPNQIAKIQIQDYKNTSANTIPVNTLQTDEKGKYVLLAVQENGKLIARKRMVTIGELYQDRLEVKSGLNQGDKVITEGFQNLYDGQLITTTVK